jgi:hypothetical protein
MKTAANIQSGQYVCIYTVSVVTINLYLFIFFLKKTYFRRHRFLTTALIVHHLPPQP